MRIIVLLLVFTAFAGAQTKKFATDSLKVNGGLIVKGVDVTDFVVTQPSGGGSGFDHASGSPNTYASLIGIVIDPHTTSLPWQSLPCRP